MTSTVKTIELHIIQSLPSSNVNRDDTGSPKTATFGGVTRLRVSSQSWKKAIREHSVFDITGQPRAERTRLLKAKLLEQLEETEESTAMISALLEKLFSKMDKDGNRTSVALYVSQSEIETTAQAIANNWDALIDEDTQADTIKKIVKQLTKCFKEITSSPEIALFGRMMATNPHLAMEAACQVSPALSTHATDIEEDFFTAVDTLAENGSGAAMMGYTPFASGTVYRYMALHWPQLVANLAGDVDLSRSTVEAFINAAVVSMPSGMKNRFANNVPPSFIMAVVRDGGFPLSLVNAFERPVRVDWRNPGLVQSSVEALEAHWLQLCRIYGEDHILASPIVRGTHDLKLNEATQGCEVISLTGLVQHVLGPLG